MAFEAVLSALNAAWSFVSSAFVFVKNVLMDPCQQHAIIADTHILFIFCTLIFLGVRVFWRWSFASSFLNDPRNRRDLPYILQSPLFHVSISLIAIICSINFIAAFSEFWPGWGSSRSDCPVFLELLPFIHGIAWLCMGLVFADEWNHQSLWHLPFLRVWWFVTLILCTISLVYGLTVIHQSSVLSVDALIGFISWPVAFFLCLAACLRPPSTSNVLTEPLLQSSRFRQSRRFSNAETEPALPAITPWESANPFSALFFCWINPLLELSHSKSLTLQDLPLLAKSDRSQAIESTFSENPERIAEVYPSVAVPLWNSFSGRLIQSAFWAFLESILLYLGPALLGEFVSVLGGNSRFTGEGYVLCAVLFTAKLLETVAQNQLFFCSDSLGMNVRSALSTFIFSKAMNLSHNARRSIGNSDIVNYLAIDVQRVAGMASKFNNLWTLPLQIIIAFLLLFWSVGLSMIAGVLAMVLIMIIQLRITKRAKECQDSRMIWQDKRLKTTAESLNTMDVLKMFAWEDSFRTAVEKQREEEMKWLSQYNYLMAANISLLWISPLLVSVITFFICAVFDVPLSSSNMFTAIATFRLLQEPLRSFPDALSLLSHSLISLNRLDAFSRSSQLQDDAVDFQEASPDNEYLISIENGYFAWDADSETPVLKNIGLQLGSGARVGLTGPPGSGKSSLLCSLLGEMTKLSGTVMLSGSVAYVPQIAWIQNASVETNIRFGRPMHKERYELALRVCGLYADMAQLPLGDQTIIGDQGVALTEGQKQRVQLARAIYQDADVYLLDNPFESLDVNSSHTVFKDFILEVLRDKAIIFVTNQIEHLAATDLILVMKDGEIIEAGQLEELQDDSSYFSDLLLTFRSTSGISDASESMHADLDRSFDLQADNSDAENDPLFSNSNTANSSDTSSPPVTLSSYFFYLTLAYSGFFIPCIIIVQILFQLLQIWSNYWLATGVDAVQLSTFDMHFILVYAILALGGSVFVIIRALLSVHVGLVTAQCFFLSMWRSLLRAPMSFFESTSSTRILARSSADQNSLDMLLFFNFGSVLNNAVQLLGAIVVMTMITWPVIIFAFSFSILCVAAQNYQGSCAHELTKIDSSTQSPILTHFSEALNGSIVIRAYDQTKRFQSEARELLDNNLRAYFHLYASNYWLAIRLDCISALILSFSALLIVIYPTDYLNPGLAGLSLLYGLTLSKALVMTMWHLSNLRNRMLASERIRSLCMVQSEAPTIISSHRPSADWPSRGTITMHNLQFQFKPNTPLVLKGITLTIKGGEKIGVVGLAGSGRSAFVPVLFRLVEPCGGRILIDGLDITTIGLTDLRSRLGIVSREPVLFDGTLRMNLDPFGTYTDACIWEALEKCGLFETIQESEKLLESSMMEISVHWTMGQKQLLNLCRCVLRRHRVLIVDDVSVSLHPTHGSLFNQCMKENFFECTIINIIHRITSSLGLDRVLVLEAGRVREFESPGTLLNRKSLFSMLMSNVAYSSNLGE